MIRELYRIETVETSLNVVQGQVESVRRKNIVKSGCRVYEGGFVGIAGTLGEATEVTWAEAEANLSRQVPYPYTPEQKAVRHEDRALEALDSKTFTQRAETLLARLRETFPQIIFSNKINMTSTIVSLSNDAGLDYVCRDQFFVSMLLAKDVNSAAVFETAAQYVGRRFDVETIFRDAAQIIGAHLTRLPMPEGKTLPLIVEPYLLTEPLDRALDGQLLHRNASLFSGKLGQQLFSPDLTFCADRTGVNGHTPFFDAEGSILPGDCLPLIENGVVLRGYADKKTAAEFGVENTTAASGSYNGLPQLSGPNTEFRPSGKPLQALLQGRDAALVVMASGGDCTPEGILATPVQTAYLYRDGKLLGRLPEFSARGSIFDLLGKDYLGLSQDRPFCGCQWLAVEAEVTP